MAQFAVGLAAGVLLAELLAAIVVSGGGGGWSLVAQCATLVSAHPPEQIE